MHNWINQNILIYIWEIRDSPVIKLVGYPARPDTEFNIRQETDNSIVQHMRPGWISGPSLEKKINSFLFLIQKHFLLILTGMVIFLPKIKMKLKYIAEVNLNQNNEMITYPKIV